MNAFYGGNGYRVVDLYDFEDGEVIFQNAWGVSDGDLYRKAVKEANRAFDEGKPFFYNLMTTSNHRPYTFPEGKIDIPSGTGGRNGAVKYSDFALGEFLSGPETKMV
jgi:phosphoglycerol transferase MdoB-like AlkP superfamily enzyme